MLKNDDLYSEIENLDTIAEGLKDPYQRAMLKSQTLVLKLLHNVRTNQTQMMRNSGIELRKPKVQEEKAPTTK